MPNVFLKPEAILATALGVLERELLLPRFVTRLAGADFRGKKNDTLTMRVPARLQAREYEWRNDRSSPIVVDEIEEVGVDVKLDRQPYSAVALTDEQLMLDISDFNEQVLDPQIRAVAEWLEELVATTIEGAPHAWTVGESDPYKAAAMARAALNKAGVPIAGRALILGADVETEFLSSPLFVRADTSGSDNALRDALIGRVAGFDTFVSQFIDAESAFAVHTSGFGLANMAPLVPAGCTYGQSRTYGGYAMRWIRDYDSAYAQDRSVLSAFAGCSSVNDGIQLGDTHEDENVRVVKLTGIGA